MGSSVKVFFFKAFVTNKLMQKMLVFNLVIVVIWLSQQRDTSMYALKGSSGTLEVKIM